MGRPFRPPAVSILVCLLLAACGGGSAGGGAAGGGDGGPAIGGDGPGKRSVPGYVLSVERRSDATAGAPLVVRVTIASAAGSPAIGSVQAWLGRNEYAEPAATAPATPVAGHPGIWEATTTLPDPLPGDATLWLRLTAADGSVIEVGRDAFQIATLPAG